MTEDTGRPELTELEIAEGLKHSFGSVQGAFLLMQEAKPTSELGEFIKERDLNFVQTFMNILDAE